jgi:WD domain, G-beta repeat
MPGICVIRCTLAHERTIKRTQVTQTEPPDGEHVSIVQSVKDIVVTDKPHIRTILSRGGEWALMDWTGTVALGSWPLGHGPLKEETKFQTLLQYCGSDISSISSTTGNDIVACSKDGLVWIHSLDSNSSLVRKKLSCGVTCLLPADTNSIAQTGFYLGHSSGCVSHIVTLSDGIQTTACCRAHSAQVTCIAKSPDGYWLVTCAADKTMFFFRLEGHALIAHCFLELQAVVQHVVWLHCGIMMACSDGTLRQVQLPADHNHARAGTYKADVDAPTVSLLLPTVQSPDLASADGVDLQHQEGAQATADSAGEPSVFQLPCTGSDGLSTL